MKVLFVHQKKTSFVECDLRLLKEEHEVRELCFTGRSGLSSKILSDLKCLYEGIKWCDVSFSWFGKLHAFFAVLFSKIMGKKAIVVAGGDDVACVPEIKYGIFCSWWKKWCPLFVFKFADQILPVSKYNEREAFLNARANPCKTKMIYHGFDPDYFKPQENIRREEKVITIAMLSNETTIKKGIELFIRSAAFLPDVEFLVVGPIMDALQIKMKQLAPGNVKFPGGLYGQDLIELCSRSKVYVQASFHESFGCSLAEAMLCECIPVVSRNGAIPEVAGDSGVYLEKHEPHELAEKIKYALGLPKEKGEKARERIVNEFPLIKRRRQLLQAIQELIQRNE